LDLKLGVSFLNIGAGTGYLSSIVSEIVGEGVHHGVDVHKEIIEHAHRMFAEQGKNHIKFFHVNAHDIDTKISPRYDRIYIGACVGNKAKQLLQLLEVGGVLVAPFEASVCTYGEGRHFGGQSIRRVVRRSQTEFEVTNLKPVSFGHLMPSSPPVSECNRMCTPCTGCATCRGPSQKVQTKLFALPSSPWTPETHKKHSKEFRDAIWQVLLGTISNESPLHILPRDILIKHIFGYVHPRWFEPEDDVGMDYTQGGPEEQQGMEAEDSDEEQFNIQTLRALAMLAHQRGQQGDPAIARLVQLFSQRRMSASTAPADRDSDDDAGEASLDAEDTDAVGEVGEGIEDPEI